jgi:hypothetical protein
MTRPTKISSSELTSSQALPRGAQSTAKTLEHAGNTTAKPARQNTIDQPLRMWRILVEKDAAGTVTEVIF